ncbi:MAG: flagellar basal body P-ring protein FlgI [Alphaproteobacteria bacterium]|nr:flagellar basal body P-ring protein FlgI [Alphaproteobacteria bacterium]
MTLRRLSIAVLTVALGLAAALAPVTAGAASRIKDIADFEGVRANQLIGYGLVVGLAGTGDDLKRASVFTRESLIGMLERLGVSARSPDLEAKNVAAVMVTAVLPPFGRHGTRIDVTVSAIGSATSLNGGTLLVTPILGADGEVYAVAQGNVTTGGFQAQGQQQTVQRGVPTSGRISNGAIIEREVQFELASLESVKIALRNPDLTTARRVATAVNAFLGQPAARSTDPGTVVVQVPPSYRGDVVMLLTDIEQLRVEPDQMARVVIDERTGIIVMGENVRISTVAVAQGNLTVRITETPASVGAPTQTVTPGGAVVVTPGATTPARTDIQVDDQAERRLGIVQEGVSLQDLVNGLNALGIGPRDMISILQAIKASGAMQAELEIM